MTSNNMQDIEYQKDIFIQIVSFFAADANTQIEHFGDCSFDYFYGDTQLSRVEKYLVGMSAAYEEMWYVYQYFEPIDLYEQAGELREIQDCMFWLTARHIAYDLWTKDALVESPMWRIVRRLAKGILHDAGVTAKFPYQPLNIEELAEPPTPQSVLDLL